MATTAKKTATPTFRITDDASFGEFCALLGVELADKGALPMIRVMRAAADQGRAFTIDGWSPSEAAPQSPQNYTVKFLTPKGEGVEVLSAEYVRENAGTNGKRGRISLDAFKSAVAVKVGENELFVHLTSVVGDLPDSPDLTVKQSRPRKAKGEQANGENADTNDENNTDDDE